MISMCALSEALLLRKYGQGLLTCGLWSSLACCCGLTECPGCLVLQWAAQRRLLEEEMLRDCTFAPKLHKHSNTNKGVQLEDEDESQSVPLHERLGQLQLQRRSLMTHGLLLIHLLMTHDC